MEGFGAKLKAIRKAKGLRQEDVAKELALHRTAYTKYETDRAEPPLQTLFKLCRLLDVSLFDLLGEYTQTEDAQMEESP